MTICHTREGDEVEILARLPAGHALHDGETIIGIVNAKSGRYARSWHPGGRHWVDRETNLDIVDLPS